MNDEYRGGGVIKVKVEDEKIFVPIQPSIQRDFFSAHALGQNGKISILSVQPRVEPISLGP